MVFSQSLIYKVLKGTKDTILNFMIPKKVLEVREKTWDKFFDRYSKEMSDEFELNVETLEPETEEEEEDEDEMIINEEHDSEQRVPMRKSPALVQYWIDTGNPPYKVLSDDNVSSESGSSLSEKEIVVSPPRINVEDVINVVSTTDDQKCKNESSCSSVDTAAYILSNANITKKADTIAIIEGAKCTGESSNIDAHDGTDQIKAAKVDQEIYDDNDSINIDVTDVASKNNSTSRSKRMAIPTNEIQSDTRSQKIFSIKKNEIKKSDLYPTAINTQTLDIESIFKHFNKTSKNFVRNNKNDNVSNQDKVLEMDTQQERHISEATLDKKAVKNMNLSTLHRKKLYSGRYSPVDLIQTETHGTADRLSKAKKILHPALDFDDIVKETAFLNDKCKRSDKPNRKFKKGKSRYLSKKNISDIDESENNKEIQDKVNIIDDFDKSLDINKNLDTHQNDVSCHSKRDDGNISENSEKSKRSLEVVNEKPKVVLQRIDSPSLSDKLKLGKNIQEKQENFVKSFKDLSESEKSHSSAVVNLKEDTVDSNQSTILILECNENTSQSTSSSDCLLDVRLNRDFYSNAKKQKGKPSRLKDSDKSQNNKSWIEENMSQLSISTVVESQLSIKDNAISPNVSFNKSETYSNLYEKNQINNIKMREVKIVLERLPLSTINVQCTTMEKQALNKNDAVEENNVSGKLKARLLDNAEKKYGCKIRNVKIVLEQLPAKKINTVKNTDITLNKKSSSNTSLETNRKLRSQIARSSETSICENDEADVQSIICSNHSLGSSTSKKSDDTFGNIIFSTSQNLNSRLDSTKDATSQHKNCNDKTSQGNNYFASVLTSDEDDFFQSIKHRKKLKVSTDDNVSRNGNSSIVNCSPRKNTRELQRDESVHSEVSEIKSSDDKQTTINSSRQKQNRKSNRYLIFSSSEDDEDKDDNLAANLPIKRKVISPVLRKRNKINYNSKNGSKEAVEKNKIDRKNVPISKVVTAETPEKEIIFRTKLWDSDSSSDSILSTHKKLKTSSVRKRSIRCRNRAAEKEMVNDFSSTLNSSLENSSPMNGVTIKSNSLINEEAKRNRRLSSNSSDDDIERKVNNVKKDRTLSSSLKFDHARKARLVRESTVSSTSKRPAYKKTSLENEKIFNKSSNSPTKVQSAMSTPRKLFETKCYYDSSDSSEIL
ncbi:hypothetical protein PUN28_017286 [Cardiocondyla obscurior]|uniref:Uncharacterized protein n=1 Tax=Cardiocondyla obscurior TaxID=286306 RepID=A0AAW2EN80_9HYME